MLTGTMAGLAVLFFLLSVPLAAEKVPPNRLYGFRTPRTVEDERVWYPVNRVAGRNGIVLSAILALASAMAFFGVGTVPVVAMVAALFVAGLISTFISASRIVTRVDEGGPLIDYSSSIGKKSKDDAGKAREKLLKKLRKE